MRRYRRIKIYEEDYKKLQEKQAKMNGVLKKITGKPKRIPMIRVLKVVATEPIYLRDIDLKSLSKKNVRKKQK